MSTLDQLNILISEQQDRVRIEIDKELFDLVLRQYGIHPKDNFYYRGYEFIVKPYRHKLRRKQT